MQNKSPLLYAVAVIVIIVAVFGLYWYLAKEKKDDGGKATQKAIEVLSQTTEIQTETNPVKKVPDLNPTEKTNPFKTANPFQ